MEQTKFILGEEDLPTRWYNIQADLPEPLPPVIHPGRMDPVTPDDLAPIFPMELIMQEVSQEPWIEIPEPVRDVYRLWRPTPMYRARRWEKALDTPARIYYKWEGVSPPGSHKPNTAVAQAYYNKAEGQIGSIESRGFKDLWFSAKEDFFRVNPSLHCKHHCVANAKNRLILDYLEADEDHLAFV